MTAKNDGRMKRWGEQRWLLDTVIQTVGVEWDQPRIAYMSAPAAPYSIPEFRSTAARIKRVSDFAREFSAAAKRREAKALVFEKEERLIAARESYLTSALLWATARWPIFEKTETLEHLEERMNHCYGKFAAYSSHPVEIVKIPFEGKELPAYLHLPHEPAPGETFPCVINIPGMDSSKENGVSMYGDPYLERGFAVLSIDGPGQAESVTLGIFVTATNHMDAARTTYQWLADHPAIDTVNIAIRGTSFGSFWGLQWAAALGDKVKGVAVTGVCHEPGCHTIFNMASPSFKLRYMFMSNYDDEESFNAFAQTIDARPIAPDIQCPVLIVAGEEDQLSPIEFSYELFDIFKAPKEILVYEGANHALSEGTSIAFGENPRTYGADWLADRIADKPAETMQSRINSLGTRTNTPR
ncbi:MAG: alpha/beta hydrolase [Pseudomonadota bacterium]|nr:alpha/beta hydrolase [Pseudomonadota bacterium]